MSCGQTTFAQLSNKTHPLIISLLQSRINMQLYHIVYDVFTLLII